MPKVHIDLDLCDACGICASVCPSFVLEVSRAKVRVVNPKSCLGIKAQQLCSQCVETVKVCRGCVTCVKSCPTGAIEIL